jgi:hypothetical protein
MNAIISSVGLIALLGVGASSAEPVVEQKTAQYSYAVTSSTPRLHVRNIWGNVTVRPGKAREISVTLSERRSAPTRELFAELQQRIQLTIDASGEGVSMMVGDPDKSAKRTDGCRGCRADYQFDIVVPPDALIDVGTVTDGRVEVIGVRGPVNASNVNGPVAVKGLSECTKIASVNGALDVEFSRAPGEDCALETLNGGITLGLPAGTGLNAILKIGHGDIETEFDAEPMALPARIEKQDKDARSGYLVEQPAAVRVGAGGPTFTFASLNGDVRIRKNK